MSHEQALTLRVSTRKEFRRLEGLLFVFCLLSALLSPQPIALMLIIVLFFGAGRLIFILDFFKVPDDQLTLIIFPDGRVRLKSACGTICEGFLDSRQWCTQLLAVLGIKTGGTIQKLLILSANQQTTDDFQRLTVWLRQDYCGDTCAKKVSAI